jgi:hypothetical protein
MSWIRTHLKIVLPVTLVVIAGAAYVAFGFFGVHTLFIDDEVDEAGPVFDSGVVAADVIPEDPAENEASTTVPSASAPPVTVPPASTPPADTAPPTAQVVTLAEGSFIPLGRYSGAGTALVLNDGSEQRFLRFEDFSTDNGPDLDVYLVNSDAMADQGTFDDDFVDLGELKGNIGDQNYEIPPDVDLSVYDTVVVWCVRFSTGFTAADLIAA